MPIVQSVIAKADWQEVTSDSMKEQPSAELTRRTFFKEILKGACQIALPAGLITFLGPYAHRPLKKQIDRYWDRLFPLKEPPEYRRENPEAYLQPPPSSYDPLEHRYAYVVDTGLCIGCGRCVHACKLENHIPLDGDVTRTWVERYFISEDREVFVDSPHGGMASFPPADAIKSLEQTVVSRSFFVPKLCNQCDHPPCTQVCPVGATFTTEDGVVLVDRHRCIGCMYCIQVCPYGVRFLHPTMKVAEKCTWCYHRITRGALPACVEVCPRRVRVFGDLNDKSSPVRRYLQTKSIYVLKEELGTKPRVYYQGYKMGVI